VTAELTEAGIGWGLHYPIPCHRQPAFARAYAGGRNGAAAPGGRDGAFPVAEAAADRIVSLPMSPTLDDAQVARVCDVLRRVTR
jgi:dTDP-4-amino-4,6-dideoxygalactose transaminase